MTDLDAIRDRHQPFSSRRVCRADGDMWPCDAAQALARVAELELERDQQERFKWAANERADRAEARSESKP